VLYSPEGGPIEIRLRRQDAMALVTVTDAGIGIPADDVPRLFGRFFRGSNVNDRQYPGLGLSLFICRAIVEQHGGRIAARSEPGRGTTLEVTLPLLSDGVQHAA
jgi:signal transduction histidine kinase